jgi:hypothetical protein
MDAVFPVEDKVRTSVGVEHRRRGEELLDQMSGLLAARAIAGAAEDRRAGGFEPDFAALACRGKIFWLLTHGAIPFMKSYLRQLFCRQYELSTMVIRRTAALCEIQVTST